MLYSGKLDPLNLAVQTLTNTVFKVPHNTWPFSKIIGDLHQKDWSHCKFLPQVVKESLEIFFHLNRVIFGLSHTEYPEFAIFPCAMLFQQKWQQHQKAPVMNNPPDVDITPNLVPGIGVPLDPLGY